MNRPVRFRDGTDAIVNGVTLLAEGRTLVIFGEDPACLPRKHSGRRPPEDEE